jgi:hypothetical protein
MGKVFALQASASMTARVSHRPLIFAARRDFKAARSAVK